MGKGRGPGERKRKWTRMMVGRSSEFISMTVCEREKVKKAERKIWSNTKILEYGES